MKVPDEVSDKLDVLIGLFELAYAAELATARSAIRSDEVSAAILDQAAEWQAVGALKTSVAAATGTSEKTAQRRIAELIDRKLLRADGHASARRVKTTGLA